MCAKIKKCVQSGKFVCISLICVQCVCNFVQDVCNHP